MLTSDCPFQKEIFSLSLILFPHTFVISLLLKVDRIPIHRETLSELPGWSPASWSYEGRYNLCASYRPHDGVEGGKVSFAILPTHFFNHRANTLFISFAFHCLKAFF